MKMSLLIAIFFITSNAFAHEDCSPVAKSAVNAIVKMNASRLGINESVISVQKARRSRTKQVFVVTTRSGEDSTYEWIVKTSNNCQVNSVIFDGGI